MGSKRPRGEAHPPSIRPASATKQPTSRRHLEPQHTGPSQHGQRGPRRAFSFVTCCVQGEPSQSRAPPRHVRAGCIRGLAPSEGGGGRMRRRACCLQQRQSRSTRSRPQGRSDFNDGASPTWGVKYRVGSVMYACYMCATRTRRCALGLPRCVSVESNKPLIHHGGRKIPCRHIQKYLSACMQWRCASSATFGDISFGVGVCLRRRPPAPL